MELVLLAFQMIEETAHSRKSALPIDNHLLVLKFEFGPRQIKRDSSLAGEALEFCE